MVQATAKAAAIVVQDGGIIAQGNSVAIALFGRPALRQGTLFEVSAGKRAWVIVLKWGVSAKRLLVLAHGGLRVLVWLSLRTSGSNPAREPGDCAIPKRSRDRVIVVGYQLDRRELDPRRLQNHVQDLSNVPGGCRVSGLGTVCPLRQHVEVVALALRYESEEPEFQATEDRLQEPGRSEIVELPEGVAGGRAGWLGAVVPL